MVLLPAKMADTLIEGNIELVYVPIKNVLTDFAMRLPPWVTPNRVTLLSLLCAIPVFHYGQLGCYWATAFFITMHDVLDRLDGSVAIAMNKKGIVRTNDWIDGGFFDAMADKFFALAQLGALASAARERSMGALWVLMWVKMLIACMLIVIRMTDWLAPKPGSAIKARGEGKYAVATENAATVCLCVYLSCTAAAAVDDSSLSLPLVKWLRGGAGAYFLNFVHAAALFFLSTSCDLGADSFMNKWWSRYPPVDAKKKA